MGTASAYCTALALPVCLHVPQHRDHHGLVARRDHRDVVALPHVIATRLLIRHGGPHKHAQHIAARQPHGRQPLIGVTRESPHVHENTRPNTVEQLGCQCSCGSMIAHVVHGVYPRPFSSQNAADAASASAS